MRTGCSYASRSQKGASVSNGSTLLLGLDGIVVDTVSQGEDGASVVVVGTAEEWVGKCPKCRTRSSRSKGWVTTQPRDIKIDPDRPQIVWQKRKWLCTNMVCKRKSFTEATPAVPARARMRTRAKSEMACMVLDDDRSVVAVAAAYGCTWNACHDAVAATADLVLGTEPGPVTVLGIDETRRGKAKYEIYPETGKRVWIDRFDTGLIDITGAGGLLVQVNGRSAKPVSDWLAERDSAWRESITHVAIDMPTTYAKAARDALPHAELIVDRFHLVKRANQMVEAVRRRITWNSWGRRGRKADPEWINRRRLLVPLNGSPRPNASAWWPRWTPPTPTATSWPPGSPRSCCATCSRAPRPAACATISPRPCTASTPSVPPPRYPGSMTSP